MRRDELMTRLRRAEPAMRAHGAVALYVYGSHARDEAGAGSDVDVFVDVDPGYDFDFDEFMAIYAILRQQLGTGVDYTTREGLVEFFRPAIEKEAVRVF
jgi:predicted nucleotidyltransferase